MYKTIFLKIFNYGVIVKFYTSRFAELLLVKIKNIYHEEGYIVAIDGAKVEETYLAIKRLKQDSSCIC